MYFKYDKIFLHFVIYIIIRTYTIQGTETACDCANMAASKPKIWFGGGNVGI